MKKLLYIFSVTVFLGIATQSFAQRMKAGVTYQTFYNELQPYGNWINYPSYGYVWQPAMGNGFRPYETGGQWVSTVDGWAWASDYNWGWAPFHYGRWLLDPALGWVWIPGYEWAPAWVQWGNNSNYYAWAPLSPGINIGIGNSWMAPAGYWSYIPHNCIYRPHVNRYVVRNNMTVNNITVINNYNTYNKKDYYHRGPDYKEVQGYTHTSIKPLAIAEAGRPGRTKVDNKLEIYRPQIAINQGNAKSVPTKVKPFDEAKNEHQSAPVKPTRDVKPLPNTTQSSNGTLIKPNEDPASQQSPPKPTRKGQGAITDKEPVLQSITPTGGRGGQVKHPVPNNDPINGIKGPAEESAGPLKPKLNNGGIKAAPIKENNATTLPEPKIKDEVPRRQDVNDQPNSPITQPIPKPIQQNVPRRVETTPVPQPAQQSSRPVQQVRPVQPARPVQPRPVNQMQPQRLPSQTQPQMQPSRPVQPARTVQPNRSV